MTTIYFIEDEDTLNSYVYESREGRRFGDCRLLATDLPDDAIQWAASHDDPALFVVDSRVPMTEPLRARLAELLKAHGLRLDTLAHLDVLVGTLATLLLRQTRPDCRIIILSAYYRTIMEMRAELPELDALLGQAVNGMLAKNEPQELTRMIREQLAALGGPGRVADDADEKTGGSENP